MRGTSCLIAVSLLCLGARVGVAQRASQEDFQAWLSANGGRWVGEVTWVADWPGLGKKGDKITGFYSEARVVADGRVLVGQCFGGSGTGRWITVYDAEARQIRHVFGDSGGRSGICVPTRQESQWRSQCSGSLVDGTKMEADLTLTISDNGDTHTWTGSTTIGGEPVDRLHDVFRRVGR